MKRDILRTLLNTNAEVKIGNSIFKMTESGVMYEITNGDLELLNKLQKSKINPENYLKSDVVIVHYYNNNSEKGSYKANVHRNLTKDYDDGKKRYKSKITVTNGPFVHYGKATTRSYKKKRKRWKHYKTNVFVKVEISVYQKNDDGDFEYIGKIDWQDSKSNDWQVNAKVSCGEKFWTKKNTSVSQHNCGDESRDVWLTW